ncbi:TPA: hypothetical protein EYP44_00900 [Candidatus Bathyarchaeota archaeon]|nr:hypothetical protein [Candidatus Bathyarchaeota archaeon]
MRANASSKRTRRGEATLEARGSRVMRETAIAANNHDRTSNRAKPNNWDPGEACFAIQKHVREALLDTPLVKVKFIDEEELG